MTHVSVHTLKGAKVKDVATQTFDGDALSSQMHSFIDPYLGETPFHYISLLDNSLHQGALPTCKVENFLETNSTETYQTICYGEWSSYTSKIDLNSLEKKYSALGVDFIFSPFALLENFFRDKLQTQATLYVLVQDDSLAIAVFEHSKLNYAEFVNTRNIALEQPLSTEEEKEELSFDGEQLAINLEEIELDDEFSELDDFANIEDLDSMDEFDDFTDTSVREKEIPKKEVQTQNAGFNDDYKRFEAIKESLRTYYSDEKNANGFIESIYIATACDLDHALKNYLEEELFLKVFVRQVEIASELFDLALRENI